MINATSTAISTGSGASHPRALAIVTLLFFLWGLLTSLNDVLIPHLKAVYELSYLQAMLVQSCFFGAYFLVSLPAGRLLKRIGYQRGVVVGLAIAAAGCAVFYPASTHGYALFLGAFFVLASGITVLQVAANPFVTVLGPASSASRRLTLTQAFNSLGTAVAPALGGFLILGNTLLSGEQITALSHIERLAYQATQARSVQGPYLVLAAALLAVAYLFSRVRLPAVEHAKADMAQESNLPRHLIYGTCAIFLYVGAEVAIGSFLINFLGDSEVAGLGVADAARYVSFYWGGAMLGRFVGVAAMRSIEPGRALAFNAGCVIVLLVIAISAGGTMAMWSMIAVGLFNSIMFPVIFSMSLHKLGPLTERGSSMLCMAIVGGAVIPFVQGFIADTLGLIPSFMLPVFCYVFIMFYGTKYRNLYLAS
jgi:FHS family L-fucose permease-like MFS transporter